MSHIDLFNAGFGPAMLPVIPPGATIAPNSTVTDPGKTPGKWTHNGWVGVNLKHTQCADTQEAERRDQWGASVGFACGREGLVGLDVDIPDEELVTQVRNLVSSFGVSAHRRFVDTDTHHKELLFFRVVEDVTGEPLDIASRDIRFDRDGNREMIQIIGAGKQFVVEGVHVGTGAAYKTEPALTSWDDVPLVPLPVFESLLVALQDALPGWGCTPTSALANSAVRSKAQRYEGQIATEKECREWLELVPNSLQAFPTRDEWVTPLYAIYGASEGEPWGRDLWLDWCSAVPQTPGLPEAYWDRINPDDVRSGMGWIRLHARRNSPGKAAMLDFKYAPDIDPAALAAVAANHGQLWPLVKRRYAYLASQHRFVDLFSGDDYSVEALDTIMLAQQADLVAQMPAGVNVGRNSSFVKLFAIQPDRPVVHAMTYHPGKPRIIDGEHDTLVFNRWRPGLTQLRPNTTAGDVQLWLDLVRHVWGSDENAMRVLRWMAFVVQFPDRKPNWHPVIITKPGIGKDMTLRALIHAIGVKNHSMIGVDEISSSFNQYLEARLVVVNEVKQRASGGGKSAHDIGNDIKKYLTAPPDTVTVNRKSLRPYAIANLTAWVFMSNEMNPLYVGDDDRRYWIVDNRAADKLPSAQYARLHRWLTNNLLAVATYLMEFPLTQGDIDEVMGAAPMTSEKKGLIALNQNPVVSALEDMVADARAGVGPLACLVATSADIRQALMDVGLHTTVGYLGRYLSEMEGCRPVRPDPVTPHRAGVARRGSKGYRLWVLGSKDAAGNDLDKLSPSQLVDLYESKTYNFPAATVLPFDAKNVASV